MYVRSKWTDEAKQADLAEVSIMRLQEWLVHHRGRGYRIDRMTPKGGRFDTSSCIHRAASLDQESVSIVNFRTCLNLEGRRSSASTQQDIQRLQAGLANVVHSELWRGMLNSHALFAFQARVSDHAL